MKSEIRNGPLALAEGRHPNDADCGETIILGGMTPPNEARPKKTLLGRLFHGGDAPRKLYLFVKAEILPPVERAGDPCQHN